MVNPRTSLIGMRFGRLKVISQAEDYISPKNVHASQWLCKCDCGNETVVARTNLTNGNAQSCGCYRQEIITQPDRGKKYNTYNLTGDYGIGYTSNNNTEFYFDLEDYDKIKKYAWAIDSNGYIFTRKNSTVIKLHQLIFGKNCDHINRNRKDNRKSNLRKATSSENARNQSLPRNNTSTVIGVNWHKKSKCWTARIYNNENKRITLGYFHNFDDAVKARLLGEKKYYGDFAPQKHLYKDYGIED